MRGSTSQDPEPTPSNCVALPLLSLNLKLIEHHILSLGLSVKKAIHIASGAVGVGSHGGR